MQLGTDGVRSEGLPNKLEISSRSGNVSPEYRAAVRIKFRQRLRRAVVVPWRGFITSEDGIGGGSINGKTEEIFIRVGFL